jgi:stage V sporulation protein K
MLCKQQKRKKTTTTLEDMIAYTRRSKRYKDLHTHLVQLDAMIGLEELKEAVIAQIQFLIANKGRLDDHFLNTVIKGPPGCGKTSVAELLFNIWNSLDIFGDGDTEFHILHRSDFVGSYMGHTANKTRKMLEKYSGQVIFIDEAYSLCTGDKDEYGKEALDQLNAFMSEEKGKTVVIIAGYEDQLNELFFGSNGGLERRFGWSFTIKEYTIPEMYQIFLKQLKKNKWSVEKNCQHLFEKHTLKNAGGDTDNIAFKSKLAYSKRCWRHKRQTRVLKVDDIKEGIRQHFINKKDDHDPTHNMYI